MNIFPEFSVKIGKVAGNDRDVETVKYGFLGFTLEQEPEGCLDTGFGSRFSAA